jgi:hypothetical protein
MSDSAPYRSAIAQYGASHQQWPTTMDQIGLAPFSGDRNVSGIDLAQNGVLTVNFANASLHGHVLLLTPYVSNNAIHWSCGGDIPAKWLPPSCKDQ